MTAASGQPGRAQSMDHDLIPLMKGPLISTPYATIIKSLTGASYKRRIANVLSDSSNAPTGKMPMGIHAGSIWYEVCKRVLTDVFYSIELSMCCCMGNAQVHGSRVF